MTYCNSCGAQLVPGAAHCPNCGAATPAYYINTGTAPEAPTIAPSPFTVVQQSPPTTAYGSNPYAPPPTQSSQQNPYTPLPPSAPLVSRIPIPLHLLMVRRSPDHNLPILLRSLLPVHKDKNLRVAFHQRSSF